VNGETAVKGIYISQKSMAKLWICKRVEMMKVLLVEENKTSAVSMIEHLEYENVICDYAASGVEGMALTSLNRYDVIIIDINMSVMSGITMCENLRSKGDDTPVLMLSAGDNLESKIEGFKAGTDDYMSKPFDINELCLRVNALSKRRSGQVSLLEVGQLRMNLNDRTILLNDEILKVTPTGFKILAILLRVSPEAVSNNDLTQKIWGDEFSDSNKLRVHIHTLRKALRLKQSESLLKQCQVMVFGL